MSKFYSTIQGQAGEATRRGSSSSGIRASVQSYDGSLIARLEDVEGQVILSLDTSDDSRSDCADRQFRGTIEEFNSICQLYKEIKEGKVSITRHREKSNKQLGLERAFK